MKKTLEGRKPVPRSLLPLAKACPDFTGFAKGENRSERIHEILLGLIQRYRQATPRSFYAMREVADFFGISLTTAYLVYQRLRREGAVTLMRSSQTMIVPRSHRPKFALRGVVCMPIWMPGFLVFLDWRRWFSELEQELTRHRFVLEAVFFKQGEDVGAAFADRVLKFNPDYVLWNAPVRQDRMTMQSITDVGVPILSILTTKTHSFPGRIYRRSTERGMRQGLKEWEASGEIDRVVVTHAGKEFHQGYALSIQQSCSLMHKFSNDFSPHSKDWKHLATARRTGIIFADAMYFANLCTIAPEKMFQLFRRHRVMVTCEVTLPCLKMPTDLTVDILRFPGRRLARRIADDLSQSKGSFPSTEEVFEAEWRPRTPLAEIAQPNFNE